MRALFVQHDHVSPTGPVADRLRERGFEVDEILVVDQQNFASPNVDFAFPDLADYDLIVPMGAPWGAWDDACIGNWLLPEIAWVREAIDRDIPVLGIGGVWNWSKDDGLHPDLATRIRREDVVYLWIDGDWLANPQVYAATVRLMEEIRAVVDSTDLPKTDST